MCGRVVSAGPSADILDVFGAHLPAGGVDEWEADYNLAPTDPIRAVYEREGERKLRIFRWGLVPASARTVGDGPLMINARAETVATKGIFARLLPRRRCIVPADGFYEWRRRPGSKTKQPYFVHPPDGGLFAFAGLFDVWRSGEEPQQRVQSLTIITTDANGPMQAVHDRMPVILPPGAWDAWLDPGVDDIAFLVSMLVPAPDDAVALRPVSGLVNSVRNDGPGLIAEVTTEATTDGTAETPDDAPPEEQRLFTPD